ncbi:hypothetical protein FKW77_007514 [Venturia effusa]|uniref:Cyclin N-terminal domain-containing protein n=1 Tax=Venturia effusa TaxID=50376 RepID=A0A517LHL0_9PEZI|nr:hypothetical protein FKW77_007514 [Venturia effusa]
MAYSTSSSAQNKAALDYFIQLPVSKEMISYLATKACSVIKCDDAVKTPSSQLPTPPVTPPTRVSDPSLPTVEEFITSLVERSHVQVPTLMTSLVYLARLKARLPPVAKGMKCTVHRIFLASLILAAKNLNDSSPKNKHWARYTSIHNFPGFGFSITEVNLMEKQLLYLLDWDLRITSEDLYLHLDPFLAPIRDYQIMQEQTRLQKLREKEMLAYHQAQQQPYSSYLVDEYSQPAQRKYSSSSSSSSRAAARTPSLSPPSRSSTSSSSPDTESLDDMYDSREELYVQGVEHDNGTMLVHIQAPEMKASMHRLQSYDDMKPAKKARTGGAGFLSRLMGGQQRV